MAKLKTQVPICETCRAVASLLRRPGLKCRWCDPECWGLDPKANPLFLQVTDYGHRRFQRLIEGVHEEKPVQTKTPWRTKRGLR